MAFVEAWEPVFPAEGRVTRLSCDSFSCPHNDLLAVSHYVTAKHHYDNTIYLYREQYDMT